METCGLHISVGLRLWGMSIILLLMMCETREVAMHMMHKINWDLLANIVTVLSFFSNCILDITTLEMRVNISQ